MKYSLYMEVAYDIIHISHGFEVDIPEYQLQGDTKALARYVTRWWRHEFSYTHKYRIGIQNFIYIFLIHKFLLLNFLRTLYAMPVLSAYLRTTCLGEQIADGLWHDTICFNSWCLVYFGIVVMELSITASLTRTVQRVWRPVSLIVKHNTNFSLNI